MISSLPRIGRLVAALLAVGLASCGGGGDDDGGSPATSNVQVPSSTRSEAAGSTADVSVTNFNDFSGPLARLVSGTTNDSLFGSTLSQGALVKPSSVKEPQRQVAQASEGLAQALAFTSSTQACPQGGTLAVTVNDADSNNKLSLGDSVSLTANNCVLSAQQPATNGQFALTVNAVDLNGQGDAVGLYSTGTFSNFNVGSSGALTGSFDLWAKQISASSKQQRLSYKNIHLPVSQHTIDYNVDVQAGIGASSATYSIDGAISIDDKVYKVVQGTPFTVAGNDMPSAGSIGLKDAAGDTLQLTAKPNGKVDFLFIPFGSTTPTGTLLDQSWSSFKLP